MSDKKRHKSSLNELVAIAGNKIKTNGKTDGG